MMQSSSRSSSSSSSRLPSSFKVRVLAFAGLMFVLANFSGFHKDAARRMLSSVRTLCETKWPHGHWPSRAEMFWEQIYAEGVDYSNPEVDEDEYFFDESNIAYVVALPSCPEEGTADPCDPGHALYDAAAMLKYNFCEKHMPNEQSKYTSDIYALTHPSAIRCRGPDGEEYDRVAMLREMGYKVMIHGDPVGGGEVGGKEMYDKIEADVGLKDLIKLGAVKLDGSPVAVLVNFNAMPLGPMEGAIDNFIASEEHVLISDSYTLIKPDRTLYDQMVTHYKENVAMFPSGFTGAYGTRGLLEHFYGEGGPMPGHYAFKPDPNVVDICRSCGEPWKCPNIDNMVDPIKTDCSNILRGWFQSRIIFEEQYWTDGVYSHLDGQYHPDIYKGFCFADGPPGYDMMIDDKVPDPTIFCDANTVKATDVQSMDIGLGRVQNQALTLETSETTKMTTACISGTMSKESSIPYYNIALVIDISLSTKSNFGGNYVGDMNGDGNENKIIDAEIAAVIALLENIVADPALSNDNVLVGLIFFYEIAEYKGAFPPADPNDPTKVNPAMIELLTSIKILWGTNFDDGLDKAIDFFNEAPTGRTNIMYFLSDGKPYNRGDGDNEPEIIVDGVVKRGYKNHPANLMYDSELAALDAMNVERYAIGVGKNSEVTIGGGLDMIDNTPDLDTGLNAIQVTTTETLTEVLQAAPIPGTVSELTVTVNGVLQPISAANVTSGPTGFSFGVFAGTGFNPSPGVENTVTAEMIMMFNDVTTVFSASTNVIGG